MSNTYIVSRSKRTGVDRNSARHQELRSRVVECLQQHGPLMVDDLRERLTVASLMLFNSVLDTLVGSSTCVRKDGAIRARGDDRAWPWAAAGKLPRGRTRGKASSAAFDALEDLP